MIPKGDESYKSSHWEGSKRELVQMNYFSVVFAFSICYFSQDGETYLVMERIEK
jgi:hypothetical protein